MLNPNKASCGSCHYYAGGPVGECHRYPSRLRTTAAHWCGEHAQAKAPEPEPPIAPVEVAAPVKPVKGRKVQ